MKAFDFTSFSNEQLISAREIISSEIKKRKIHKNIDRRIEYTNSKKPKDDLDRKNINADILEFNSSNILHIPNICTVKPSHREKYLECLIRQDWFSVYDCEITSGNYYVYAHVDPSERPFITSEFCGGNYGGKPFYIGKGIGSRAFDLKRNQGHGAKLREILSIGFCEDSIPKILFSGLSSIKAYEIESKLIYFFGTIYQKERKSPWLLNLDIPKTPEFSGVMKKVLSKSQIVTGENI